MTKIIKEIMKVVPEAKISEACFEGANIVLYSKNKDFVLEPGTCIDGIQTQGETDIDCGGICVDENKKCGLDNLNLK